MADDMSPSNNQAEQEAVEPKTGAFSLSPERLVRLKLGTLWAGASFIVGCVITCTVYVVRMEGKVDQSLAAAQEINAELKKLAPQHAILWNWYERTASRGVLRQVGP